MRMMPSDPKFREVDFLMTHYAHLKNPQVHFDLHNYPQEFRLKDLEDLYLALELMFLIDFLETGRSDQV